MVNRAFAYPVTVPIRQDITGNSTLYTAGDAVGAAFTCAGVARFQVWTGWLADLEIIEVASQQKPALQVHFFDRPTSVVANNAPYALGASDMGNKLFSVTIQSSDWQNVGATTGASANLKGLGYWFQTLAPSCDIYGQIQNDGAPTWTTPNPILILKMRFQPD